MHSAAIAGMRCPSICLSVRPSVTFVSCAKTNKDIFEIFSPCGSHAILVFPHQTGWRYSNGNPPPTCLLYVQLASIGFARSVEYVDLSTQTLQRLLYTLLLRLELTTAIPCWLGHQRPSQTGFNVCLMRQTEWSVVRESLIAACPNCFTPSYIGWTFLSVSSIKLES